MAQKNSHKITYNVTVQTADGTERTVTVNARDERQLHAEAEPYFHGRGEKIVRVEPVSAGPSGPASGSVSAEPSGPAPAFSPLGGEGRGEGSQQAPQDLAALIAEQRRTNELLDAMSRRMAGRKSVALDVAVGIAFALVVVVPIIGLVLWVLLAGIADAAAINSM